MKEYITLDDIYELWKDYVQCNYEACPQYNVLTFGQFVNMFSAHYIIY